jgi:large subunit ribosomal protein L5
VTTEETREQDGGAEGAAPKASPRRRAGTKAAATGDKAPKGRSSSARKKAGGAASTSRGTGRRSASRKAADESQAGPAAVETKATPRLLTRYREEISAALATEFGYASAMQVPRLTKITLNIGLGEAQTNARAIENATRDMEQIAGQRPVTTKARKSVAGFKVREGMVVGLSVTLRGRRMYEFYDRLVSSTLPRIRDFRGLPRESFDGRGNYSIGIREQVIFPEIDYNSIDRIRGLQVAIVTSASSDREGFRLLELMGMPFARTAREVAA